MVHLPGKNQPNVGKYTITWILWVRMVTLPETNIAPENGWLEDEFPFRMIYFQVRTVSFREGTTIFAQQTPCLSFAVYVARDGLGKNQRLVLDVEVDLESWGLRWLGKVCDPFNEPIWLVLIDEQMSNRWPFSLLNGEQMSNKVRVEHQPAMDLLIFDLLI